MTRRVILTVIEENVAVTEMSNKEVCRVQFTSGGPPRLILSRPSMTHKEDYNIMPYNYGHSPILLPKIGGLTRNGRCFTPEELKRIKGKEVVDKSEEISKPVIEEETNEFLKLMKHSEYSIVE